jgi:hypothetical protein
MGDDVGYFGSFLFDGRGWTEADADDVHLPDGEYWLHVNIHDSDIATITYHPTGPGSGIAYLGCTPRTYFEEPTASLPTDVRREAEGLTVWWAGRRGGATDTDRVAMMARIRPYLAHDVRPEDIEFDGEEDQDLDDAEVFVEVKTDQFLVTLGLPPLRAPH